MDELAREPDALGEVSHVLGGRKVVEDDGWLLRGARGPQRDGAAALGTRQIHPELEAGDRDELRASELTGQRQELVLHIGVSDIIAGAQECASLEQVARSEALPREEPPGTEGYPAEQAELRGQ